MTIPDFPTAVHARATGGGEAARGSAAVVVWGKGVRAEVASLSAAARRRGLRPGMRWTEARARVPELVAWDWDDRLYARAECECLAALLAASPRVARVGGGGTPGALWLEVGGWERRGGERVFAEAARGAILAQGYLDVRVGIADTAAAAWAASRIPGKRAVRVPPGRDAEFLGPLAVGALPLSEPFAELLAALGVERVADLVRLGRAGAGSVEARLGAEGLRAWRWACGRDERRPFRRPPEQGYEVSVELDGIESLEPLLFVLKAALGRAAADLGRRGECARRLDLVLGCDGGAEVTRRLVPARPTRDARIYLDLARAALEGVRLPAPATELVVRVEEAVPAAAAQGDLFERRWVDPLAWSVGHARLAARLGPHAIVRPEPRDAHRPEAGGRWVPVRADEPLGPGRGGVEPPSSPALVLHLLPQPAPIGVRTREGRPTRVRLDGRWARVESCLGPERISGEWWGDPYRREYYRIFVRGGWHWIFRDAAAEGAEGATWRWHGWWD